MCRDNGKGDYRLLCINYVCSCITSTTNLHHNTCLTLSNQSLQPVAIAELVCVLLTLLTMSNVALGLSFESRHLASLARLPGMTYLRTCNIALTQMYSRKGSRHFRSKVHSSQIDFISVFMYFSIVSAPGHFCIAELYKFSLYCIALETLCLCAI